MPAALVLLGYLSGSVPFGILLTRWFSDVDVRSAGSGNIGATNVARVAGKKLAASVLLLDAIKGALPTGLALWLLPDQPAAHAATGLAAFLGHVFPVWLRLKGGKGVATALGVLLVLTPWAALGGVLVYAAVVKLARISSLGSLAGAAVTVVLAVLTARADAYRALAVLVLLLILWTHRGNIRRLRERTERRF